MTMTPIVLRGGPRYDGLQLAANAHCVEILGEPLADDGLVAEWLVDQYVLGELVEADREVYGFVGSVRQRFEI